MVMSVSFALKFCGYTLESTRLSYGVMGYPVILQREGPYETDVCRSGPFLSAYASKIPF